MSSVPRHRFLLIASISLATICFQLLITKVLAFVFWNHIVSLVILIALLGYGAASTMIAVKEREILSLPPDLFLGAARLALHRRLDPRHRDGAEPRERDDQGDELPQSGAV